MIIIVIFILVNKVFQINNIDYIFEMNRQKVYLNSCELLLDNITIYKQYPNKKLYFLWKKGKKYIKSPLYDIQPNQILHIRERFEMSLKIYHSVSQVETKNTILYIVLANDKQQQRNLSSFVLAVDQWTNNYQKVQLQLKQNKSIIGVLNIQIKRRQIMELQNFHKFKAQIEESSQSQSNHSTKLQQQYSNMQLIQMQKQVEDYKYLNEKLKKDRSFLLSRNDTVQNQIKSIKLIIQSELTRMKQYYNKKISTYTSIYQQQIQYLISTFNQQSDTNTHIMRNIINQNEALAVEIEELRKISQEELEKQEAHYKLIEYQAKQDIQRLEENLEDLEDKILQYEKQLTQTNKKLQSTKQQLDNTTINYSLDKKQFSLKCQQYEKQLQNQRKYISDLKNQLQQLNSQLTQTKESQQQLNQQLKIQKQKYRMLVNEKNSIIEELNDKKQIIQRLTLDQKQNKFQIKNLEEEYQYYVKQSEKKVTDYQKQMQEYEMKFRQRELEFDKKINEQIQKFETQHFKVTELGFTIQNLQKNIIIKEQQIKVYTDDNNKINQQFLEEHKKVLDYQDQIKQLLERLEQYKILNQTAEEKVAILNQQLDLNLNKNKEDLEALRFQFQNTIKNRQVYYEQEIRILREKLQNNDNNSLKLNQDFREEIELYRDQIQKSQQELLKQMNEYNELNLNFKKVEFECAQYQHLLNDAKQAIKQREIRYEQTLRMYMNRQYNGPSTTKKDLVGSGSLDFDLEKSGAPSIRISSPKRSEMDNINEQYLNQIKKLANSDHIKQMQITNAQAQKQIDRVERQNNQLLQACSDLERSKINNEKEISRLRQEMRQLQIMNEHLRNQIRQYLDQQNQREEKKEEKKEESQVDINEDVDIQVSEVRSIHNPSEKDIQVHELSPKIKIQQSAPAVQLQKKSSKKNLLRFLMHDQQIQVQIITQQNIAKYEQYIKNEGKLQRQKSLVKPPEFKVSSMNEQNLQYANQNRKMLQKEINQQKLRSQRLKNQFQAKIRIFQQELKQKSEDILQKNFKVQKLQARNKQIFEQMQNIRQQYGIKLSMQQSKFLQYSQNTRKDEDQYIKLKNTIQQKQQQLRNTQQNFSLQLTKIRYESQQFFNQNKKLKRQIQEMQQKNKKSMGFQFTNIMNQQMEDANRKIIQSNRSINQLRMEKQSAEDQLRLFRKKLQEQQKNMMIMNENKCKAEQQLEITIRKYNKLKRQTEDKQSQLTKYRDQCKKMQEEIQSYSSVSSNNLLQRKKNIQQRQQIQQQLNKKQSQIRRLTKQLTKAKQKLQEHDQYSHGIKNQTSKQIQRLSIEMIKYKKQSNELQDQVTIQNKKLAMIEDQHKQKTQQLKQYYRQKLNTLINEINEIKDILGASDEQIQHLQAQKSTIKQELENCLEYIVSLEDLKTKFNDEKEQLEVQINKYIDQLEQNKKQIMHYQQDSVELHNRLVSIQEELNKERMLSLRKSQRNQQLEMLSEKYLYEIKNLKVQLSQYASKQNKETNLLTHAQELEKQANQLKQQLIMLSQEYQRYKGKFTHTKQQVEQLVLQLKEEYQQLRKKQLADTIDELDHEYQSKSVRRQKQILELYNQNAKIKTQIQRKQDENSQLLQKYTEIQKFPQKYKKIKEEFDAVMEENAFLKQQQSKYNSKAQKLELQIKEYQRVVSAINHQLEMKNNQFNNEMVKSKRIQQELLQIQTAYNMAKDEVKKISSQNLQKLQKQKNMIQSYEQKILSYELENTRIKQREENMHKEYRQQTAKMQMKFKQLLSSAQQQAIAKQRQFKGKLTEKDRLLKQANKQLGSISVNFKSLQNQLQEQRQQNDILASQLANTRQQLSEDEQIYISEINKLKNNAKDTQQIYNYNLNSLEEELAQLNRQLTMEKLNNRQQNGLNTSRLRDSEVDKRLEDRIKIKDTKIQELKNNIFVLESTIVNLKRKNQMEDNSSLNISTAKYQSLYNDLLIQFQNLNKKYQMEGQSYEQAQRQLRKQLLKSKQNEQNCKLLYDQQALQLQSVKCQLSTVKQIYETLQKQLQKRQIKLTQNVNNQSKFQKQLQQKITNLKEMQIKIEDKDTQNKQLVSKLKSKDSEIQKLTQKLKRYTEMVNKIKSSDSETKKMQFIQAQILNIREENQKLLKQNKRLINEIDILKSDILISKNKQYEMEKQINKISKEKNQAVNKIYANQEIIGKYTILNQKSLENHGVGLEQLILGGYIEQKMFDQEQELNQLKQDYEQLKFSQDRKELEYNEMKKQNFQLCLKVQDYEFVSEQVQTLRKICDKLEEEKKIAVFRQEAIRVRLTNLIHRNQVRENIKDGLEAILNYNYNIYT